MMIYSFHSTFYILLGVFVVFLFFFMIIRSVQSENSTSTNNNGHKSINLLCSVSDEKYYWMMQLVLYTSYGCFSNSMTKCWFVYLIWSGLTVFDSRGGASFGRMLESKRCRCAGSSILFFFLLVYLWEANKQGAAADDNVDDDERESGYCPLQMPHNPE